MGHPTKWEGPLKMVLTAQHLPRYVFKDVFEIELPRRVKDQKLTGVEISKEEMRPGDLVVFKTGVFFTNKQTYWNLPFRK